MAGRRLRLTPALWSLAAVSFVFLLGGLVAKDTLRTSGCTGPRRAGADAFARDFAARGRIAAGAHVSSSTRFVARNLPFLGRATPEEVAFIVQSGMDDSPFCRLFAPDARVALPPPGRCFGYELPQRLSFVLGGLGEQGGFAVTVGCDSGRWRVTGFI